MRQGDVQDLREAVQTFVRRFGLLDQAETPCGMPLPVSHAHALMELLHSPGLTQNELAERLGLSKSNISRLVGRLVANRRVERREHAEDGRAWRLHLTEKGRRTAMTVDERSIDRFAAIAGDLAPVERRAIVAALARLTAATPPPSRAPKRVPAKRRG